MAKGCRLRWKDSPKGDFGEQRPRLEIEGVYFNGKRRNMELFKHQLQPCEA